MDFGLSEEISSDVSKKADVFAKVSVLLEKHFLNKDFGEGIKSLTVGIICVRPEADLFFKERKKYTKSKAMLEYDIKLSHPIIKEADKKEIYDILARKILDSLSIIDKIEIANFEIVAFRKELESFFQRAFSLL